VLFYAPDSQLTPFPVLYVQDGALRPLYRDGWCTPFREDIGNTIFQDGAVVLP